MNYTEKCYHTHNFIEVFNKTLKANILNILFINIL